MKRLLALTLFLLMPMAALAQATPAGVWKTIDDSTKAEKSLVRITEEGGMFIGRIEKLLSPDAKPGMVCDACTDERKGKPLVGLIIIQGVKKNPEEEGRWDGGSILDPANGKTYRVRMKPLEGGKKLEVRGYMGVSLFGRTQTWLRAE